LDPIQQRPGLGRAEIDFLEAAEQSVALRHGAPHGIESNLRIETVRR
jgi:hypothetical protein